MSGSFRQIDYFHSMVLNRESARDIDRFRALKLLTSCRNACTEAMVLAHGFTIPLLVELIRARLATAITECVMVACCRGEKTGVRITEAGQRAFA